MMNYMLKFSTKNNPGMMVRNNSWEDEKEHIRQFFPNHNLDISEIEIKVKVFNQ